MPLVYLETFIKAEQQLVFDLSRNVDLHKFSMTHHKEEAFDGVKEGLMNKGDIVVWTATHFFKRWLLKVQITDMQAPDFFCDEMIKGDFKKMKHEHHFNPVKEGTLMIDRFYFESPIGILGRLANELFLKKYMTRLLVERNAEIKRVAESDRWKQFLNADEQH